MPHMYPYPSFNFPFATLHNDYQVLCNKYIYFASSSTEIHVFTQFLLCITWPMGHCGSYLEIFPKEMELHVLGTHGSSTLLPEFET